MIKNLTIKYFDKIDSTNDYLSENIKNKIIDSDCLVIAKMQTNGHGSFDRAFISDDNGIYFSLGMFYDKNIMALTPKVAVAIYNSISNLYNIKLDMKWVNDLYYNNKKVVGILCKYIADSKCYIIGVGIDLYENKNLTDENKNIIGYIFDNKIDEQELVLNIVNEIYNLINKSLPDIYKNNNLVLNKKFVYDNNKYLVKYINDEGNMVAENLLNKKEEIFNSSFGIVYE